MVSVHGTAFPVTVGGKGPAGSGNNLVLDERMDPHRIRPLLFDEVCRLQGHRQVVIDELERLLPHDVARRARLAGRGPARAAAEVAVHRALESSDPERRSGGPDREQASVASSLDRCGGGPQRHTRANIRVGLAGDVALQAAEELLLENQITSGTRTVYQRGFNYFRVWCAWRGIDVFFRGGAWARREDNELIKFVAYFGVVCEYAFSTVHTWLHGIQHAHILHGLGDPLAGKLRLRLCRQGLKLLDKKRRGRTNKTAATVGLLSELVNSSGMDYTKWDDTVLAAAALFGFLSCAGVVNSSGKRASRKQTRTRAYWWAIRCSSRTVLNWLGMTPGPWRRTSCWHGSVSLRQTKSDLVRPRTPWPFATKPFAWWLG